MTQKLTAILIDDDPLMHVTWRLAAEKARVNFHAFESMADFEAGSATLARTAKVYLDGRFPNGVRGESYIQRLRDLGFNDITIATAMEREDLGIEAAGVPVIGKHPPFRNS